MRLRPTRRGGDGWIVQAAASALANAPMWRFACGCPGEHFYTCCTLCLSTYTHYDYPLCYRSMYYELYADSTVRYRVLDLVDGSGATEVPTWRRPDVLLTPNS
jgi:hypothetical protein